MRLPQPPLPLLPLASLLLLSAMSATLAGGSSGSTRNVLGGALRACGAGVGYYRDGFCRTDASDRGVHVVAAVVDERFLSFTASRGNDLSTPRGASFPGLRDGDRWCLCALRWKEALEAGVAPRVDLAATNIAALKYVRLEDLVLHALPGSEEAAAGGGGAEGELR